MTQTLRLRQIKPDEDLSCVGNWFAGDVAGNRHMASYANPEDWRRLFSPSRRGWLLCMPSGDAIGFIDMEIVDKVGYFSYYVAPASRNAGYGTQALRALIDFASTLGIGELIGGVEPDNAASIAALRKAGFEVLGLDEDGMFPVRTVLPG